MLSLFDRAIIARLPDRRCCLCGLRSLVVRRCRCCDDLSIVCDPCGVLHARLGTSELSIPHPAAATVEADDVESCNSRHRKSPGELHPGGASDRFPSVPRTANDRSVSTAAAVLGVPMLHPSVPWTRG